MPIVRVVFDINVFVAAVDDPEPLPALMALNAAAEVSDNPQLACLATIALGAMDGNFPCALIVTDHIVKGIYRTLRTRYGWAPDDIKQYLHRITELCDLSGGGFVEPSETVTDCIADWEDNRILEAAGASGALLIISDDHHLLDMRSWRGTPIISARDFVGRAQVARRAQAAGLTSSD